MSPILLFLAHTLSPSDYKPFLPMFESHMQQLGYKITQPSSYSIGVTDGDLEHTFSHTDPLKPTYGITIRTKMKAVFNTKFEFVSQAVYTPLTKPLPNCSTSEMTLDNRGGGTFRLTVPYACIWVQQRPIQKKNVRGFFVNAGKQSKEQTIAELTDISNRITAEFKTAIAQVNAQSKRVSSRLTK
jgi:hypothetical protein